MGYARKAADSSEASPKVVLVVSAPAGVQRRSTQLAWRAHTPRSACLDIAGRRHQSHARPYPGRFGHCQQLPAQQQQTLSVSLPLLQGGEQVVPADWNLQFSLDSSGEWQMSAVRLQPYQVIGSCFERLKALGSPLEPSCGGPWRPALQNSSQLPCVKRCAGYAAVPC
jgi:hypothetical protein